MVLCNLKHENVISERVETQIPCVGVVGIFYLQFVAGIIEVVKKKQRDSKILACNLGTCKSSHYKKNR